MAGLSGRSIPDTKGIFGITGSGKGVWPSIGWISVDVSMSDLAVSCIALAVSLLAAIHSTFALWKSELALTKARLTFQRSINE